MRCGAGVTVLNSKGAGDEESVAKVGGMTGAGVGVAEIDSCMSSF